MFNEARAQTRADSAPGHTFAEAILEAPLHDLKVPDAARAGRAPALGLHGPVVCGAIDQANNSALDVFQYDQTMTAWHRAA